MNDTATNYRIRLTIASGYGPQYERSAYVAKRDGRGTWDGSWYTEKELDQIQTWKTRRGAENWLAQRPVIKNLMGGAVEEAH